MLDRMRGNAVHITLEEAQREVGFFLLDNETVQLAFKMVRDMIIFTNLRLIFYDKQGLTGKKKEYHNIPYKSIIMFSAETASTFDRDADLKVWVSGKRSPFEKSLKKGKEVVPLVLRALSFYTLSK